MNLMIYSFSDSYCFHFKIMAGMADARTDEIACSFCLEYGRYLTRPRSLPCGHYYCEPCLETDFIAQKVVRCIRCR